MKIYTVSKYAHVNLIENYDQQSTKFLIKDRICLEWSILLGLNEADSLIKRRKQTNNSKLLHCFLSRSFPCIIND